MSRSPKMPSSESEVPASMVSLAYSGKTQQWRVGQNETTWKTVIGCADRCRCVDSSARNRGTGVSDHVELLFALQHGADLQIDNCHRRCGIVHRYAQQRCDVWRRLCRTGLLLLRRRRLRRRLALGNQRVFCGSWWLRLHCSQWPHRDQCKQPHLQRHKPSLPVELSEPRARGHLTSSGFCLQPDSPSQLRLLGAF